MLLKSINLHLFLSIMFVNSFVRSKASYAKALGLLCLALQVYLLGSLLEINAESLKAMIFWNQVQYIGIPFFPALWLLVSILYTGRGMHVRGFKGLNREYWSSRIKGRKQKL